MSLAPFETSAKKLPDYNDRVMFVFAGRRAQRCNTSPAGRRTHRYSRPTLRYYPAPASAITWLAASVACWSRPRS